MEEIRLEPPPELNMNIGQAMFSQRAIRSLKPDPISDANLKIILDAASKAPNGGNRQPGRFLVIRDREKIRAFGELYREAWWCKRRDEKHSWTTREEIPDADKVHQSAALLADEIKDAPVIILVFAMRPRMASSVFPPIQNMLLAAHAMPASAMSPTARPPGPDTVSRAFSTSLRPSPSVNGKADITWSTTLAWASSSRKTPATATRKMSSGKIEKRT